VHLSEVEDRELLEFQKIEGIPTRVKERAEIVRLNRPLAKVFRDIMEGCLFLPILSGDSDHHRNKRVFL
jgi:hypothetical protein